MTDQDIQFPAGKTDIVALTGVIAPGFVTTVDKHPYPRSIHVLEDTLTLTSEVGHPHS
jgi:hypothetical protein